MLPELFEYVIVEVYGNTSGIQILPDSLSTEYIFLRITKNDKPHEEVTVYVVTLVLISGWHNFSSRSCIFHWYSIGTSLLFYPSSSDLKISTKHLYFTENQKPHQNAENQFLLGLASL